MFSQPARTVALKRSGAAMELSSRKTEDSNKPPISKPAWINHPKKEQTRKDTRIEKETKPTCKSNRQRSYSEVENVEVLYSAAKSRDKSKHDERKLNTVLSKIRGQT